MSVIGHRFYFACVLVFIFYVSLAVHEIIDTTGKTNEFGGQLEFLNRSVVAGELMKFLIVFFFGCKTLL